MGKTKQKITVDEAEPFDMKEALYMLRRGSFTRRRLREIEVKVNDLEALTETIKENAIYKCPVLIEKEIENRNKSYFYGGSIAVLGLIGLAGCAYLADKIIPDNLLLLASAICCIGALVIGMGVMFDKNAYEVEHERIPARIENKR